MSELSKSAQTERRKRLEDFSFFMLTLDQLQREILVSFQISISDDFDKHFELLSYKKYLSENTLPGFLFTFRRLGRAAKDPS